MTEPKIRFKKDDGSPYEDIKEVPFGSIIESYSERTTEENEDVLLSCAIDGMYLNSELFSHQRGSSNKGYKKVYMNTLILSAQNLHLGNANVNRRFEHGIISPAYNTYFIRNCNPDYLAHWVKKDSTKQFFYNATTTGASECRRNVDWNALYTQSFYLPHPDEQQKIADFLSSVDEVIATSAEEVANLEKLKKAAMQKIFSQEVRFKKPDGSDFSEWEEKKLGDFATVGVGNKPDSIEENQSGYEYINAGVTNSGYTSTFNCEGDIVTTPSRGQGGIGYVGYQKNKFWLGALCYGIRAFDKDVLTKYIYYSLFFNSKAILDLKKVGSVPAVNREDLIQVLLPIPCLEEQKLIADFFTSFDEAITAAKQELEKWKLLKKGLLQKMFV